MSNLTLRKVYDRNNNERTVTNNTVVVLAGSMRVITWSTPTSQTVTGSVIVGEGINPGTPSYQSIDTDGDQVPDTCEATIIWLGVATGCGQLLRLSETAPGTEVLNFTLHVVDDYQNNPC